MCYNVPLWHIAPVIFAIDCSSSTLRDKDVDQILYMRLREVIRKLLVKITADSSIRELSVENDQS